jgi:predicted dehydrogenase
VNAAAAVVGTGFIGAVHVEALQRIGVEVTGVVGSSPERAAAKGGLPPAYPSFEAMLEDPAVGVVHITTPNHLHHPQVKAALAAGKHVVCEKPLAVTSEESAELLALARESGLVHCTNFNVRFYPIVQHLRALVREGALGEIWNVHGGYLQDWLALPTDWNWRLEPAKGGSLRAVADIGSHWLDLVQFATGGRVARVFADFATVVPVRLRPRGEVATFAAAGDGEREEQAMETEDLAHVLLRFDGGARGSLVVSQVSAGRRNSLRFEIDGSNGAAAWDSERAEELWLGHRGRPNETLLRDPSLVAPEAGARTGLPAGHAEGFADTFKELYRTVYRAITEGRMPESPDFPTFEDGHRENLVGEALALSNGEERWVDVPR